MNYIYSERARACIPVNTIVAITYQRCEGTIDYPSWFEEDNPGCKPEEFPYMIVFRLNRDSNMSYVNYGYYVDDISQIKQEMKTLAKLIWGGEDI